MQFIPDEDYEGPRDLPHTSLLFHGTSKANAEMLLGKHEQVPLELQAREFLNDFDLKYRDMVDDEEFAPHFDRLFRSRREHRLSTATTFNLAKSYSYRCPEWQWYSFQFINRALGNAEDNWINMAHDYCDSLPNPVVLVFGLSEPREIGNPLNSEFERYISRGTEIAIENPLTENYWIEMGVEIKRITGVYGMG